MAEIGAMLREARMREGLDVSELEARTKIRAKYLRALENEEWGLLPGPTYIKSFLRTYAEALGLDARLLVEEYKLRHDHLSEVEMLPVVSPASPRRSQRPRPPRIPRWAVAAVAGVALVVVLAILGGSSSRTVRTPSVATAPARAPSPARKPTSTRRRQRVSLKLIPTAPVYVCLLGSGGRRLINGVILAPGSASPTFRDRLFRITLGNGSVTMIVNGRRRRVSQAATGIGYELGPGGRRVLAGARRPTCA